MMIDVRLGSQTFASLMRSVRPDFLLAYNSNKFDDPYLSTRIYYYEM